MCHLSCVMCYVSCVMCHVPYVMRHASCAMCHVSYVMCHVSCVMCHMSCVTCHLSHITSSFFGQRVGASQWRVCYQRGLPRLVVHQHFPKSFVMGFLLPMFKKSMRLKQNYPKLSEWTQTPYTPLFGHY